MPATFIDIAKLSNERDADGKITAVRGPLVPEAAFFGHLPPAAVVELFGNNKNGRENAPDYLLKLNVNGDKYELGALWKPRNGGRSRGSGKLGGAVLLGGWPNGRLLLQDGDDTTCDYRVTLVVDDQGEERRDPSAEPSNDFPAED